MRKIFIMGTLIFGLLLIAFKPHAEGINTQISQEEVNVPIISGLISHGPILCATVTI